VNAVPKELDISSYECDWGHRIYFGIITVWEVKELSRRNKRKTAVLGDDDEQHAIVFKNEAWLTSCVTPILQVFIFQLHCTAPATYKRLCQ